MKNVDAVEQVRRGSCVVKIYPTPSKGRELYTLSYWLNGKRSRPSFADHGKARQEAERIAACMAKGELAVLTLRDHDRFSYLSAVEALRPTGVPLELAAIQFAEAWKLLNGASLIDAVRNQVAENPRAIQPKLVREVVDELLERKQQGGWSKLYLTDLRLRLGRFADAFKCPISSIQSQEIAGFLDSLKVAARTKNNFRRAIGTLFNFAKARSYVTRSHPGITEVEKVKAAAVSIGIFAVDEMEKLLTACPRELIPALAIGAFAGLRAEEIKRLHWSEVRLDRRHIEVTNAKAKTGGRRLVPISPNLTLKDAARQAAQENTRPAVTTPQETSPVPHMHRVEQVASAGMDRLQALATKQGFSGLELQHFWRRVAELAARQSNVDLREHR